MAATIDDLIQSRPFTSLVTRSSLAMFQGSDERERERLRLVRMVRALRGSELAGESCSGDLLGGLLAVVREGFLGELSAAQPSVLVHGAGLMERDEAARTVAAVSEMLVSVLESPSPSLAEFPMSTSESRMTFPALGNFCSGFAALEAESVDQAFSWLLDAEHPFCTDHLPSLAADAQKYVVLLSEEELRQNDHEVTLSGEELLRLIDLCSEHMKNAHVGGEDTPDVG